MRVVFLLGIILTSFCGISQTQKGTVMDQFGNPVENAYLTNTLSKTHAHSDELGRFIIDKTAVMDTLLVSAVGFKKNTVLIEKNDISIILEADILKLDEVVVSSKLSALNVMSKIDLQTAPVKSSQEILRKVPGLFIGQHAGGGKAEQIFLRGFDIDHGTDIAISVDDMPVNMVSHAHGQGYADLHFLIPETIDKIDFGKGTYFANKGDFATAGYVSFKTKEKIDASNLSVEIGQFNSFRTVGMFNLLDEKSKNNAYLATEYVLTDGAFESPQNFKKFNLFGKYTGLLSDKSKFSITGSHFTSKWNASGQIPQRLVDNGTISRFGAVDDTEGGNTSRSNFNFTHKKSISDLLDIKTNVFFSNYQFELYSNFTFFLDDPVNGDQIRQKENRNSYGFNTQLTNRMKLGTTSATFNLGLGFRADDTKGTELSHTLNRTTTLENIKLGDISQTNLFSFLNGEFEFGKLMVNPAIRMDYFKFNYQDQLGTIFKSDNVNKIKFSPKLNLIYSQNSNFQWYLKSGLGFHSNDTRVVVANTGKQILPTAFGTDFGIIVKPTPKLFINTALWMLHLDQEFVYVGDAGIVEPSGKTRRMGVDLGLRFQLTDYLFFDGDANYTYARSSNEPKGQDYIPLAPDLTVTSGLSLTNYKKISGGLHARYLKNRPANEDNTLVAKGYAIFDANINYNLNKVSFGVSVENIFNTQWNETQFATESRLQNETESVEEIHFTPGTPFFIKGKITYTF